jgi:hypothetical protein
MRTRLSLIALLLVALPSAIVQAQSGGSRNSVTVAFGGGLNTATPPGNPANHHVVPRIIDIKDGGVVNFAVAGLPPDHRVPTRHRSQQHRPAGV